jgi:hypothetical protein
LNRFVTLASLTSLLLLASTAPGGAQDDRVRAWDQKLSKADAQLKLGEHKKVQRAMRELLPELSGALGTAPAAAAFLARGAVAAAIAEAGLSQSEAALWDWQVAVALVPGLATIDLAPYGEAGRRLAAARDAAAAAPAPAGAATPPVKTKGEAIDYPRSRLTACDETPIEVKVTVGTDGKPRAPRLDPARDPALAYRVLETVRHWTFEPAQVGGQPVAADLTVRTDLTAKRCRDLLATRRPSRGGLDPGGEEEEPDLGGEE